MKEYIAKKDIIDFITQGLNDHTFGYDAIEVLAEIEYMSPADVVSREEYDKEIKKLNKIIEEYEDAEAAREANDY